MGWVGRIPQEQIPRSARDDKQGGRDGRPFENSFVREARERYWPLLSSFSCLSLGVFFVCFTLVLVVVTVFSSRW